MTRRVAVALCAGGAGLAGTGGAWAGPGNVCWGEWRHHPYSQGLRRTVPSPSGNTLWIATAWGGVLEVGIASGETRVYTRAEHSLPSDFITDLDVGPTGDVWIATVAGAGRRAAGLGADEPWETVAVPVPDGRSPAITAVRVAPDGTVWFGTYDSGLFIYEDGEWTALDPDPGPEWGSTVTSIAFDAAGNAWVGIWGEGVFLRNAVTGGWTKFDPTNTGNPPDLCVPTQAPVELGLTSPFVWVLGVDPVSGDVWFNCEDDNPWCSLSSTARYDGTEWHAYNTFNSGIVADRTAAAAFAGDEVVLAGVFGVSRMTPAGVIEPVLHPTTGGHLEGVFGVAAMDGAVWLAGDGRLGRLTPGAYEARVLPGVHDQIVMDIEADAPALPGEPAGMGRTTWVTTRVGVQRWNAEGPIAAYTRDNAPLPPFEVRCVAMGADGAVWFGTNGGGITRFDGAAWTTFAESPGGLIGGRIAAAARHPITGEMWLAAEFAGLSVTTDGATWRSYTSAGTGMPLGLITGLAFTPAGDLWLSTSDGAVRYDGTAWTRFTMADGLPTDVLTCVMVAEDGTVWFGGTGGLIARYTGAHWQTLRPVPHPSPFGDRVLSLAQVGREIWAGVHDRGLYRYDGTTWTVLSTENGGLLNDRVHAISSGRATGAWLGTENGLSVLARSCAADWSGECTVDASDITAFLGDWFADRAASPAGTAADFDGDGVTDASDLTAFLTAWFAARAEGC